MLDEKSAEVNEPLVMGFSSDLSSEIIKSKSHRLNRLLQLSQSPPGAAMLSSKETTPAASLADYSQGRDRLQALKSSLIRTNDQSDPKVQSVSHGPLLDFLQNEWDDLVHTVSSLLSLLQQPVQFATSTFVTLPQLADVSRLERRAELLSAYLWHQNNTDRPNAFRLSAFKNPKGLLLAVMRQAARANGKQVSDTDLCFQVRHVIKAVPILPLPIQYRYSPTTLYNDNTGYFIPVYQPKPIFMTCVVV